MGDDQTQQALRIFMWIVPRVNSTALTKCMGFVDDTVVWMEPYMTCRLNDTYYNPEYKKGDPAAERLRATTKEALEHPDAMELMRKGFEEAAECPNLSPQKSFTQRWVKQQLEGSEPEKKFIFIKDQALAISDHLDNLPGNVPTRHTFLIRHPREVYTSWKNMVIKTIGNPFEPKPWDDCHAADDAPFLPVSEFYQIQYDLWKHVKEHIDPDPIVVDGHDLSSSPEVILPRYFEKLGIPFKESYLEWPGDPRTAFRSWKGSPEVVVISAFTAATSRAMSCTKFEPPKNPRGVSRAEWKITEELEEYIKGAMPLYEEMYAHRLK